MAIAERVKNIYSSMPRSTVVVFVIITLLIIIAVIAFIVYKVSRNDLKSVQTLKEPVKMFDRSGGPFKFDGGKMPVTLNGQEFSFSFWMYLSEFTTTANYKLLFKRGGDGRTVSGSSPMVYLDSATNRMFVSVRTNQTPQSITTLAEVLNPATSRCLTASVEYVPLQRWMHYVVVVHDNLLTVYQDGDIYTVENVLELPSVSRGGRPVFAGVKGDLLVGPVSNTDSTRGYMGKLDYFNYALTPNDVRQLYEAGPTPRNLMSKFGINEYGVRSPIYRVDQEENTMEL